MTIKSLTLASASGVLLMVAEIAAAFVVTPILLAGLGVSQYGAWDILVGLVGYFGFLDLGMSPAILRYVAHAEGAHAKERSYQYLSTGFWSLALVGFVSAIAAITIAGANSEGWVQSLSGSDRRFMLVAAFASIVALTLPMGALSAFLLGRQKNVRLNAIRVLLVVLRALVTVWAVTANTDDRLLLLAASYLAILILEAAAMCFWIILTDGIKPLRWSNFSATCARELLSYGMNNTILMLGTGSLRRFVGIVIAKTIGIGEVAHYAVANRLVDYGQSLVIALGYPLTAHLSQIAGGSDRKALQDAYIASTRLIQFFSLGVPVGIVWMGEPFLHRWLGPEVTKQAQTLLIPLCLSLAVQGLASNSNRALFALAKHRGVAIFAAWTSPILLVVCYFMTKWLGVYGAVLTVALHGSLNGWYEMYSAANALGLRLLQTLRQTALPYAIPLLSLSVVLWMLKMWNYPSSYLAIAGYSIVGAAVYVAAAAWISFNVSPRQLWIRMTGRN